MNLRAIQSGAAMFLALLSSSARADTGWAPSATVLRAHMCDSRWVVIGCLVDVSIEQDSGVRSGSGRIAVDRTVKGTGSDLPAVQWADRSEVACPRLELDRFEGRRGVWFVRVDSSGAFDAFGSDFWELSTAGRILEEMQQSAPLPPELQDLQRAIATIREYSAVSARRDDPGDASAPVGRRTLLR